MRIFSNLSQQMSLNVEYLFSLGCAVHLYSWGSNAGVNVISLLLYSVGQGPPHSVGAERHTNNPTLP